MSTNDRELLEMAARAANVALWPDDPWRESIGVGLLLADGQELWNPLRDDGAALRLAVKLKIDIMRPADDSPIICAWDGGDFHEEKLVGDPYSATRRAIVRAAAEIVRAMP